MGPLALLLILSLLQGLTEYLPVSSSGHLVLARLFLPGGERLPNDATVEVWLHLGTLGAVLVFYRREILNILAGLLGHLIVSSLLKLRGILRNGKHWCPLWIQPAIGGLLCGILGISALFLTTSVSGTGQRSVFSIGYESLDAAFENELLWQVLGILLIFKLIAVVVTYASGGSGGLFSPALFLGG
ncbi:MAG: undecaprenyl-diphosphate phosphatase, partial [Planctomycetota bacterium]|nr:undecaprenyl-diphosphate phosphatase [Planctomycetota bacterium]